MELRQRVRRSGRIHSRTHLTRQTKTMASGLRV
jgi:hypothetical protein